MMQVFLEGGPDMSLDQILWGGSMSVNCGCLPNISINGETLVEAWTAVQ